MGGGRVPVRKLNYQTCPIRPGMNMEDDEEGLEGDIPPDQLDRPNTTSPSTATGRSGSGSGRDMLRMPVVRREHQFHSERLPRGTVATTRDAIQLPFLPGASISQPTKIERDKPHDDSKVQRAQTSPRSNKTSNSKEKEGVSSPNASAATNHNATLATPTGDEPKLAFLPSSTEPNPNPIAFPTPSPTTKRMLPALPTLPTLPPAPNQQPANPLPQVQPTVQVTTSPAITTTSPPVGNSPPPLPARPHSNSRSLNSAIVSANANAANAIANNTNDATTNTNASSSPNAGNSSPRSLLSASLNAYPLTYSELSASTGATSSGENSSNAENDSVRTEGRNSRSQRGSGSPSPQSRAINSNHNPPVPQRTQMSIDEEIENYINSGTNNKPSNNNTTSNNSANSSPSTSSSSSGLTTSLSGKAYHNPRKQSIAAEEPPKLFLGQDYSNASKQQQQTTQQQSASSQNLPFLFNSQHNQNNNTLQPEPGQSLNRSVGSLPDQSRRNTTESNTAPFARIREQSPTPDADERGDVETAQNQQSSTANNSNNSGRALPTPNVGSPLGNSTPAPTTQQPGRLSRPGPSLPDRQGNQNLHQRTLPNPKIQRIVPNTPSKGTVDNKNG